MPFRFGCPKLPEKKNKVAPSAYVGEAPQSRGEQPKKNILSRMVERLKSARNSSTSKSNQVGPAPIFIPTQAPSAGLYDRFRAAERRPSEELLPRDSTFEGAKLFHRVKSGKQMRAGRNVPFLPPFKDIVVEQDQTADCYLIALLIGILSNEQIHKNISQMHESVPANKGGGDIIKFRADFAKLKREAGVDLGHIFSEKNLHELEKKGFKVELKSPSKDGITEFRVKVSAVKRDNILTAAGNSHSNAFFINFMESFIGNLLLLENPDENNRSLSLNRRSSLDAHEKYGKMPWHAVVTHLCGYESPLPELFVPQTAAGNLLSSTVTVFKTLLEYCDDIKLGAAYGSNNGFLYLGFGIHARILKEVVRDENRNMIALKLLNPWGHEEIVSLDALLKRDYIRAKLYTPLSMKKEVVRSGEIRSLQELITANRASFRYVGDDSDSDSDSDYDSISDVDSDSE